MGNWLLSAAATILGLTLVVQASSPQVAAPQAPSPQPQASDYLGSKSCEPCHGTQSEQWKNSLHIKMTKPIAEAMVVGDFSEGTKFADHDRSYTFGRKDGKPYITIAFGSRPPETFSVDYTLGAKRYQGYLSTLPDGRIYVLPAFWHVASKRWIDWKEITPIPDGAHDIRQIWNANCFNCHATNIVQGYNVAAKKYESTWTEMGIGCEACHGPGREHVALTEKWAKDPASKPAYDTSANNHQLSDTLKILSTRTAEPRRIFDTCAYCHGNKNNVFTGFKAGDKYTDYAMPFLVSEPIPANDFQGEFWPDGRPNRFNRPQALTMSGCFKAGAIACTSCHLAHGASPNDFSLKVNIHDGRTGDTLCTQCHTTPAKKPAGKPLFRTAAVPASFTGDGISQHTFHLADSEGSRCINCHMSDVNWRLLTRRRDHTFQPPVPENTAKFGIPNACLTCHDERTPEWAAKQMNEWWGDDDRRAKAASMAETFYRAGSGDGSVLPKLATLALDRTEGLLARASAAEFIARLVAESNGTPLARTTQSQTSFDDAVPGTSVEPTLNVRRTTAVVTPAIVNSLIGAASDPEPIVRAAAVKALGTTGDRSRAITPVVARLVDQSRVVRTRAVEVLVAFGIVELPGQAGEALKKAQQDYIDSLDAFPDSASNHAAKGWLEAERGHVAEARDALDLAIAVEPKYAFPWVIKGVLAAREGKFSEAVELWQKARSIEPSYPNIDQLISEAEKRKVKGEK